MRQLLLSLLFLGAMQTQAQMVSAELITIEDINVNGLFPIGFDDPTMNSNGTVAVVGRSTVAVDDFIFVFDSIFFKSSDLTSPILDPMANQCGIDDMNNVMFMGDDEFSEEVIYHSSLGQIIREEDPAPGYPIGTVINILYRPMMLSNGWMYFVASVDEDNNGSTDSRAIYQVSPTGIISLLYTSTNALVSGEVLSPGSTGYDFDFDISESQAQSIAVVDLNTGSTADDGGVMVNGFLVLQENDPIDVTENFDNFDMVKINSNGDYIITGDSDGPVGTDEYIILNGTVQVREGDVIDGYPLTSAATVQGVDINDNGDFIYHWATAGIEEYLFSGNINDPGGLASAKMVLKRYDTLDVNGDYEWDYVITDFDATFSYRGYELKDTNVLYMNVNLEDTSGNVREAIIKIDPFCRPLRSSTDATLCFNDTIVIGGNSVTSSGIYYDTLSSIGTCQSIERYVVNVLPQPALGVENAVICQGDSVLIAGTYFSQPGTYYPVISSALNGCDSTVEVSIATLPVYDTQLTYELCQGDSILAGGSYQTTNGVYIDSLTSEYFCDSIVTRTVNFVTEYNTPIAYSICQGDSILLEGAYQTTAGTFYDTLTASFGCDSILVQTVTLNALPSVILDNYPVDSICTDGAPLALPNALPAGGIYDGNGVDGNEFDPALTGLLGTSVLTYTYTDTNGCIGSDQTSIVVYDCYLGLDEMVNRVVIYPNPSQDLFHVEMSQQIKGTYRVINELGQTVLEGNISDNMLDIHLGTAESGNYYLEIKPSNAPENAAERFKMIKMN
ncbi:MAG: T9SS type A sorting domain-containing protein [Fluviicola sp.]